MSVCTQQINQIKAKLKKWCKNLQYLQNYVLSNFHLPLCLQLRAPAGSTKAFPQVPHWWSFLPSCLFMCTLRPPAFMNILGQRVHWNSFTPRCCLSWSSRGTRDRNALSQPSRHLYGFSPVCKVMWFLSFSFLLYSLWHWSQVNTSVDNSCLSLICTLSVDQLTNLFSQCSHA